MDKTVRIGVDTTEAKNIQSSVRQSAEQLARDMIRSSRQYSTSAKEVLKDINDQIRAIEKRNKLDGEMRRSRLESMRERGSVSDSQYSTQKAQISSESRQDALQIRLLRDIIETIKTSSKEEIREDRKNVEKALHSSKSINRLGISGDEFTALKQTIQQGILGNVGLSEISQRAGFDISRRFGGVMATGQSFASGNMMGMLAGARGLMMNPAAAAILLPLAITGGGVAAGMNATEQLRSYMIATQTGASSILGERINRGGVFHNIGLETNEGMNLYGNVLRATGGMRVSENELLTLASVTRSRDISPELLNQTVGFQRYSNSGGAMTVVTAFEKALQRLYPEDFKRKLVQLPEMMNVYNSLAQQMVQTTGGVNTEAMSAFISGIQGGFGVEGQNLQRYASGMMRGFGGSKNSFVRMMQFNALRRVNPNMSYQGALEALEDPTSNVDYMRVMERQMRSQGLTLYRSWMQSMGLGAKEARQAFESGDFEKAFEIMKSGKEKTIPSEKENLNKYFGEAQKYQSQVQSTLDEIKDLLKTEGIKIAEIFDLTFSGDFQEALKKLPDSPLRFAPNYQLYQLLKNLAQ